MWDFLPCLGLGWLPEESSGKVPFVLSFNHPARLASCSESIYFPSAIWEPELQWLQLWLVPVQLWDQKHLTDGKYKVWGCQHRRPGSISSSSAVRRSGSSPVPSPGVSEAEWCLPHGPATIYSHQRACSPRSSSYLQEAVLEKHSQRAGDAWTAAWCIKRHT